MMANKDQCKNIKDPKQRAACTAKAKGKNGSVTGQGAWGFKPPRKPKPDVTGKYHRSGRKPRKQKKWESQL